MGRQSAIEQFPDPQFAVVNALDETTDSQDSSSSFENRAKRLAHFGPKAIREAAYIPK